MRVPECLSFSINNHLPLSVEMRSRIVECWGDVGLVDHEIVTIEVPSITVDPEQVRGMEIILNNRMYRVVNVDMKNVKKIGWVTHLTLLVRLLSESKQ